MNKQELLQELDVEFNRWKEEAKFNVTLNELDNVFFLRDYILSSNFVSPSISRMICARIRDTFWARIQSLHAWLMPSPYSLLDSVEQKAFSDEDKTAMNIIIKEFMSFIHENGLIGLNKSKEQESKWVDDALPLWQKHLPTLIKYI